MEAHDSASERRQCPLVVGLTFERYTVGCVRRWRPCQLRLKGKRLCRLQQPHRWRKFARRWQVTHPTLALCQIAHRAFVDPQVDCNIGEGGVGMLEAMAGVSEQFRRVNIAAGWNSLFG